MVFCAATETLRSGDNVLTNSSSTVREFVVVGCHEWAAFGKMRTTNAAG
jgi:hypothetical protein